tara:strand:+ start:4690 stop:5886 length:1197 start_codon:yes stop_codon:yes gene_type:complete
MYQTQAQARGLASLGRGPDTELVHMTKNEVNALDNMAKGIGYAGLPTNPQTGLPEAGILDTIGPILGGIGLSVLSGGTLNPLTIGLITGTGTGLATGSVKKGITGGLGGFGGASLASGLAAAGSSGAEPALTTTVEAAKPVVGPDSLSQVMGNINPAEIFKFPTPGVDQALSGTASSGSGGIGSTLSNITQGARTNLSNIGKGAKTIFSDPSKFVPTGADPTGLLAGRSGLGIAGAATLAPFAFQPPPEFEPVAPRRSGFMPYPEGGFTFPQRRSIDPFAGETITPAISGERLFFDPEPFTSPGFVAAKQGGMLTGRGDGMSDDIMLPIRGAEKGDPTIAAVSTDEFVVPADVVSGLGNGSSSAGAKQLYAMMDRVRNTRTGKESQPRQIRARKMLPA